MIWQDVFAENGPHIDVEREREQRLAAQAAAGADWALAALVARYQAPITRYLTRLCGDYARAREQGERIFVRMERRLRGPHGSENLRLWLLRASTEAGLEALRSPRSARKRPQQIAQPSQPVRLLPAQGGASHRLRAGWDSLTEITGSTRRQLRELIWPQSAAPTDARAPEAAADQPPDDTYNSLAIDEDLDTEDPRDELRNRLVRAVLAELPYGDAQCLALHLVAGLNQSEVARALGITATAARRRIVQGLQLFAQRYEAATASLGIASEAISPTRAPDPPDTYAPTLEEPELANGSARAWQSHTMPDALPPASEAAPGSYARAASDSTESASSSAKWRVATATATPEAEAPLVVAEEPAAESTAEPARANLVAAEPVTEIIVEATLPAPEVQSIDKHVELAAETASGVPIAFGVAHDAERADAAEIETEIHADGVVAATEGEASDDAGAADAADAVVTIAHVEIPVELDAATAAAVARKAHEARQVPTLTPLPLPEPVVPGPAVRRVPVTTLPPRDTAAVPPREHERIIETTLVENSPIASDTPAEPPSGALLATEPERSRRVPVLTNDSDTLATNADD